MGVYYLEKEKFNEFRNKIFIKVTPPLLIAFAASIAIIKYKIPENDIHPSTMLLFFIGVPVFMYVVLNKSLKSKFELYELKITDEEVTVSNSFTQGLTILIEDISEIKENHDGSFTIMGKSKHHLIPILTQVENKERLKEELNQITPIVVKTHKTFWEKNLIPLSLLIVIPIVLSFTTENKLILVISSCVTTIGLIWSFVMIQKGNVFPPETKKKSFWVLIVIIAVAGNALFKLL